MQVFSLNKEDKREEKLQFLYTNTKLQHLDSTVVNSTTILGNQNRITSFKICSTSRHSDEWCILDGFVLTQLLILYVTGSEKGTLSRTFSKSSYWHLRVE